MIVEVVSRGGESAGSEGCRKRVVEAERGRRSWSKSGCRSALLVKAPDLEIGYEVNPEGWNTL